MRKRTLNKIGLKFKNSVGDVITIIDAKDYRNMTIQFEDGGIVEGVNFNQIQKGRIRNKNNKTVYGVGYHGYGIFKGIENYKETKAYSLWHAMLKRCYCKKNLEKHPTYKDVHVCNDWHNFQNFAKWVEENWNYEYMDSSWELDKDILSDTKKIYSPETCCFVPTEINYLFSTINKFPKSIKKQKNTYSLALGINGKETYIGRIATIEEAIDIYTKLKEKQLRSLVKKYEKLLDSRVYKKLLTYKVEICK